MKKKMIAILAGALMTLGAGNAFAYFGDQTGDNLDLVRVVYDSTGSVEVGTDLGNINSFSASSAASDFSLSQFGTGKSFANLNVAYFAIDTTTNTLYTTSISAPAGQSVGKVGATISAAGLIAGYYNSLAGSTGSVIAAKPNALSFYSQFDNSGAAVGSASALLDPATNELNLAALSTTGFADLQLYQFTLTGSGRTAVVTTTSSLDLRTYADGSTTLVPTATPIPPAFFLMGSGLLGMVGLRRKNRA